MPDKTNIRQKYTEDDINEINLRIGAACDFADLLDYCYAKDDVPVSSVAFIFKMLLEPVEDFLSWAAIYVKIPEKEPETAAQ
jgi:hypothetical protein